MKNSESLSWDSAELKSLLESGARSVGVDLSSVQIDSFMVYGQLLADGNKRLNLSAITDPKEVIRKHFVDSLAALPYLPEKISTLTDVGSGAGLPGLALKIARPQIKLSLIESINKKAAFLRETADRLALSDVVVYSRRAEEAGQDPLFREQSSVVTARAVAALSVLMELCLPLVAVGGYFVAYKGPGVTDELAASKRALDELGGKLTAVKEFSLTGTEQRSLVLVTKVAPTRGKYPRPPGRPAKRPL